MQTNLFGEVELPDLTIEQAAKAANVSTATIRNWIKTGYLLQSRKGFILQESLKNFMLEVAGKEKLNSRANKSLKDRYNHNELYKKVYSLLEKNDSEKIGTEYENSLSNSYRNKEGIYYTPDWIVKDMFKNINIKSDFKFLDPCCGSGNFIIEAIRRGISPENVYGFDTDPNAVTIARKRVKDEFGIDTNNIKVGDFLQEADHLRKKNFFVDIIFTNPPWGKKIEKTDKERFSALYDCGNSLDTTSLFFGACLSILKDNGFLGFLVQEAFFNIANFEDIRKKALSKKVLRCADYGKVFKGLLTKAQAITIQNVESQLPDRIECSLDNDIFFREQESFKTNPKYIINFWTNKTESDVIDQIYSIEHITLKNRVKWGLGIVTGNNNKFCSSEAKEGYIPVYKGSDITKSGLKEPSTFILNDFSKFQQVAPIELYLSTEKIIYKFISSDLCFFFDKEQRYILNSANLLIPIDIGITADQLTKLLNSEIINWVFKKIFNTHKILRGDLEMLPIHIGYFAVNHEFSESKYLDYLQVMKVDDGTYRIKK